jgi:hypothetical protein
LGLGAGLGAGAEAVVQVGHLVAAHDEVALGLRIVGIG